MGFSCPIPPLDVGISGSNSRKQVQLLFDGQKQLSGFFVHFAAMKSELTKKMQRLRSGFSGELKKRSA